MSPSSSVRSLVLEESIDIAAPRARVWESFEDLGSWPQWNAVCRSARWTSGAPWEVGATFHMRLRMAGVRVPFHVRIVEATPQETVAWTSTIMTVTGRRSFRFTSLEGDGGTRVSETETFTSPVLPLSLFFPRPIVQAMSRSWLRSLKARVEGSEDDAHPPPAR